MTLGQRLQKARKESGLSQEELAEQLGVSRQAVSKWENDSGYPEMEKMIRLSQLYQVSLDYLVGNGQEPERSNEENAAAGWYVSRELAEGYLSYRKTKFMKIGICVLLVFLSSAFSYVDVYYYEYGGIEDILGTFLIMVAIILIFSIAIAGNPYKKLKKQPLVFDDEVLKQLRVEFAENKRRLQFMLIGGVIVLLTGCILLRVEADEDKDEKHYRIEIQDADGAELAVLEDLSNEEMDLFFNDKDTKWDTTNTCSDEGLTLKYRINIYQEKTHTVIPADDADAYERVLIYSVYEDSDIVKMVVDENTLHGMTFGVISEENLTFYYQETEDFFQELKKICSK